MRIRFNQGEQFMRNISRTLKTTIASAGVVGLMLLGGALPAFAATTTADTSVDIAGGTVVAGQLGFAGSTWAGITLNGTHQTTQGTFTIDPVLSTLNIANIVDATGTNAGWSATLLMPQLAKTDVLDTVPCVTVPLDCLPVHSVTINNKPTIAALAGTSTDIGAVTVGTVSPGTTPLDAATAVTLASASPGSGAGSFVLSPIGVTLSIPANTLAATYLSTAVYTFIAGAV
jgi:hypothetical protein